MHTISKTFRLSRQAVLALQELVTAGRAPSQTALVESLIRREELRLDLGNVANEEATLDAQWAAAMENPDYRTEMGQIGAEFETADGESACQIK